MNLLSLQKLSELELGQSGPGSGLQSQCWPRRQQTAGWPGAPQEFSRAGPAGGERGCGEKAGWTGKWDPIFTHMLMHTQVYTLVHTHTHEHIEAQRDAHTSTGAHGCAHTNMQS